MRSLVMALLLTGASAFMRTGGVGMRRAGMRMATTLSDFSATTLEGKEKKLSDYKGQVVLIENVASL
jgi:hypothetical protein